MKHLLFSSEALVALILAGAAIARPNELPSAVGTLYKRELNGIEYNVFHHRSTDVQINYVSNSGICETTPGVEQHSGYLSVGEDMNMWFWFFASRNNPSSAPLALWLNGGPGCSSMIGLFQEHGPCHFVNGSSEPTLNEYSWNTYANMLYVDQPIGTGFSYGDDEVDSTVTAAPYVWKLLQAFFANFPEYETRDFGLFTESYGGHYGPEFAEYFQNQNDAIDAGTLSAEKINLVALGINNGWIDATIQYGAYVDFAYNNSYRQLINESEYVSLKEEFETGCLPRLQACPGETGTDAACQDADDFCYENVEAYVEDSVDFNVYDIRHPADDPEPPETYVDYINRDDVRAAIGAQVKYEECPDAPYIKFYNTGDDGRSFLTSLNSVVQSGINVLIWAGDADWICNWLGNWESVHAIQYGQSAAFAATPLRPYKANGTAYGEYKVAGNLNWLKVYEAGHEIPYYQPKVSLQAFWQILQKQSLHSTCK